MKASFYPLIASILFLTSCSKLLNHGPAGSWQLVKEDYAFGPYPREIHPAADSSVVLTFNLGGIFTSRLNNTVISHGTYSITKNNAPADDDGTLELKGFKPTGILSLFVISEVGSGGQVLSVYDGMTMKISGNTMTLTSALTPAGFISYTFEKM